MKHHCASRFVGSLLSMVASILIRSTNKERIEKADRDITLFLSNLDDIETYNNKMKVKSIKENNKHVWLSIYNFQSLLNISNMISNFWPLINYWDCSMQGEGVYTTCEA